MFPSQYIQRLSSFDQRLNPFPETQTQNLKIFAYYLILYPKVEKRKQKNVICLHFWQSDILRYPKNYSTFFSLVCNMLCCQYNICYLKYLHIKVFYILYLEQDLAFSSLFPGIKIKQWLLIIHCFIVYLSHVLSCYKHK